MSKEEFDVYGKKLRTARDKFIAHLDDEVSAPMPMLDVVVASSNFLVLYLLRHENQDNDLTDVPAPLDAMYDLAYSDARYAYTGEPEVRYSGGRSPHESA